MGEPNDAPIQHLSVNTLSALLEPMIQNAVTNSFATVQQTVNTHTTQISLLEQKNEHLEKLVAEQRRLAEAQKRQKNIVIFGLNPTANEDYTALQTSIINLLNQSLGISLSLADIDYARRIGSRDGRKSRPPPILLALTSLRMKHLC